MEEFKIFISYAHKDDAYFRVFKEGIESHSKSSQNLKWKIWCDKEIPVGSLWHNVIQNEVQNCNAAILLISANFLSSEYIETKEFLEFLERSEKDGFIFLPVLLSDCNFMQWENLANRQFFYPIGKDYNLRELSNISYSHLCEFYKGVVEPNPYRETYHKNCVNAFENAILHGRKSTTMRTTDSFEMPSLSVANYNVDNTTLEKLSDENVLKILRLFNKQSQNRNLNAEELADAIDTRNKIKSIIFSDFDNQFESTYKEEVSSVVFDRIIAFQQIQKNDVDLVQKFRNNKTYSYQDRALIVSGLTLSLLNNFDVTKIHLLLDFVTDFEELTWQRALVGLTLGLIRYNNKLSIFQEISTRLDKLKTIPDIQISVILINKILKYRCFSCKSCINCSKSKGINETAIKRLKILTGDAITITEEDIIDIQSYKRRQDQIGVIANTSLKFEKFDELSNEIMKRGAVTIELSDFFEYLDIENYLKLHELNPFALNLKDDLFSKPKNWFYPFKIDERICNTLADGYPITLEFDISYSIVTIRPTPCCFYEQRVSLSELL